jgi:hypothetical protein
LMKFSMIWKVKATTQGRLYCQLKRVVHRTEEIGSGSSQETWATPTTMDHLPPRSEEANKKLQEGHRKGRSRPSNLREQVDEKTMMMWPTPTANEDAAGRPEGKMQKMLGNHPEVRNKGEGTLSYKWVSWLMGYDPDYLDL